MVIFCLDNTEMVDSMVEEAPIPFKLYEYSDGSFGNNFGICDVVKTSKINTLTYMQAYDTKEFMRFIFYHQRDFHGRLFASC